MPYLNIHRGARISPTKIKPIMDLIRGLPIDEAETLLRINKRRGAVLVLNGLKAAWENAAATGDLSSEQIRRLRVVDARVDQGPTMKRFQPKDRGRAHAILKRTSHITVAVDVV